VADGFTYANELVSFIREDFGDFFDIGVAGYPEKHKEAPSFEKDLENLQIKTAAGSQFIITQLFLDNNYFFNFLKKIRSMGIQLPVLAGIMPVTDLSQVKRFTEMIGAQIPAALLTILEKAEISQDPDAVKNAGIDWAVRQCQELLAKGVDGIHFYTLNRSLPTLKIFERINP
jgi:methylenetetrahydrofolate reductase (NADPH)